MKKILVFLFFLNVVNLPAQAALQARVGGYFITEKSGGVVADNTDAYADDRSLPETVQEPFALNNQDLKLAAKWLKWKVNENSQRNFVVSPLSLYVASVILANGVVDKSLVDFSDLFSVLRLENANRQLKMYLKKPENTKKIMSSVWGTVFSQRYQRLINKDFGTEFWRVDDDTSQINTWFEKKTKGKIKKLANVLLVNKEDIFVSVAASFYKKWPFTFNVLENRVFHNIDGTEGLVKMLNEHILTDYFEDEVMQVVRLNYQEGETLTIFLPKKGTDFGKVISEFNVNHLMPKFTRRNVDIFLPQFELNFEERQAKVFLESLGVNHIFRKSYDFAKMINWDMEAVVQNIFLTTGFKLNEAGGNVLPQLDDKDEGVSFVANRPFVFMVNSGEFIGAVVRSTVAAGRQALEDEKELNVKGVVRARRDNEQQDNDVKWYEEKAKNGQVKVKASFAED